MAALGDEYRVTLGTDSTRAVLPEKGRTETPRSRAMLPSVRDSPRAVGAAPTWPRPRWTRRMTVDI
jgi:hypothetical protein